MELSVISGEDISRRVDIGRIVEAVEAGFSRGRARQEPRVIADLGAGTVLIMSAHDDEHYVAKYIAIHPGNAAAGLPTANSLVLLARRATGVPLSIMEGGILTAYRTGATSAVVAKHLAPGGDLTVGFLGAGLQARAHAAALARVLRLRRILVHDPDRGRAESFASSVGTIAEVSLAGSPEAIARESDVIVAATTSRTPVFPGSSLDPERDALIISIGWLDVNSREVDEETVRRSALVVVDTEAALEESAELRGALGSGALGRDKVIDLASLLRRSWDRGRPRGPVLYKGVGTPLEDLFAAVAVYEELGRSAISVEL
ncbi:MAG: ornithine cyclodeaminase family protein [Conexivisphaera sp.]